MAGWQIKDCWILPAVAIASVSLVDGMAEESRAAETASVRIVSLRLEPAALRLSGQHRRQQLLVTGTTADGRLVDVTDVTRFATSDPGVFKVTGSRVRAVGEGSATLTARYLDREARIRVEVSDFGSFPPVDFRNDIVPLFGKLRCNGSGCHGKQGGQNGFHLTVFGFDPRADYNAIVKAARGRRIFPAAPRESLLIRKATAATPHGGGRRAEPDSDDVRVMAEWINQGTPWARADAPRLEHIRVNPTERVLGLHRTQRIIVTAAYSDGTTRDVTTASAYSSNAEGVAEVDEVGRIQTGKNPGEAAITVRYMDQVDVVRVLVPRLASPLATVDDPTTTLPVVHNNVDRLVWSKLAKLRIRPSQPAGDATFLRRLHLDVIGTLPRPEEVRRFLADTSTDKRRRAIDAVLKRPELADYWAVKWSDVLLVDSQRIGERGAYAFHRWLRDQLAADRPYDEWVRELLTASGTSGKDGPVNFYLALRTPEDLAKAVSQAFLGIRLDCAQCHHHPFEKWGQRDFYGMASFFAGLQRKKLGRDRELVFHAGYTTTRLPVSDEAVAARPLGGDKLAIDNDDPRVALANWVTAGDNPWFARLAANRIWKQFLGRGLIEPEDDVRSTNPAVNEPLLDYLAEYLVEHKFDLKALMRLVLNSQVYQLTSRTNGTNVDDEQNFSRRLTRRMPAEVLLDAISEVTGSPERFAGAPRGTRSIELWDNRLPSYFLDVFGRSPRESPCACGKSGEPTMAQALHLMNGPEIEAKIADPRGRVARLVKTGASNAEIVEELCLAALGRPPGERETRIAERLFAARSKTAAAEDFLWTLLNSYEFLFID